ncbi:hypothetical protein [Arthrobacter gyeryongensis]|uniref:hypothetical protein n=1 Tax=Arthrobacter gyeryongensis TaxID=1650592 RepID=UPI0031EF132D
MKSRKAGFKVFVIATSTAAALSLAACGGASSTISQAGATQSASASASASATPTPTPTPTAPKSVSCVTENATESYSPKVYICTKSDAGVLLWMESSESKRVTDARAAATAAAAKAAADKAAADKAAADKATADQAAADAAAAQAAAARAAQAAAAQAAAKQAAPAAPSGCDPNYAWACVPIASDVDCAGGKGNGPAYVRGPVKVIGTDIYGLDSDGDGIGCEK